MSRSLVPLRLMFFVCIAAMFSISALAQDTTPWPKIAGRVVDAATSAPLAGIPVYYVNEYYSIEPIRLQTDADGRFETGQLVPACSYILFAGDDLHGRAAASHFLKFEDYSGLTFRLEPGKSPMSTVKGRVTDVDDHTPCVGVRMEYTLYDTTKTATTYTDSDGSYTLTFPAGIYLCRYVDSRYQTAYTPYCRYFFNEINYTDYSVRRIENATGTVQGKVIDSITSAPPAGARVIHKRNCVGADDVSTETLTDANGEYRMEHVPLWTGTMMATRSDYYSQFINGVNVPKGTPLKVDFQLTPRTVVRTGIEGVVVDDATSRPLPGALVYYADMTYGDPPPMTAHVTADLTGRFGIYLTHIGEYALLAKKGSAYYEANAMAHVRTGQIAQVALRLKHVPPTQYGTVHGMITDAITSKAVSQATITYYMNGTTMTYQLDYRGEFYERKLPVGDHTLTANANGYLPQTKTVTITTQTTTRVSFELQPTFGTVKGRVLDARTGTEISYAWVMVKGTDIRYLTFWDGKYQLDRVPEGEVTLVASRHDYAPAEVKVTVTAGHTSNVDIYLTKDFSVKGTVTDAATSRPLIGVTIYYGPLYTWSGDYKWFEHGDNSAQPSTFTNESGVFAIPQINPGMYYLVAVKDGYERQVMKVTVVAGQVATADFRLKPSEVPHGSISGLVTNTNGQPVTGAKITYYPSYSLLAVINYVLTGKDGRFTINNLPPGESHLTISAAGYLEQKKIVMVVKDQMTIADIVLQPNTTGVGMITGKVLDSFTSQPLSQVVIRVVPDSQAISCISSTSMIYGETMTNSAGEYSIANIPAGKVLVIAGKPGYMMSSRSVEVIAGGEVRADFRLHSQSSVQRGHIVGKVVDTGSQLPIAGAVVRIEPGMVLAIYSYHPDLPRETVTDENGQYGFENVGVAPYEVKVSKEGYIAQSKTLMVQANTATVLDFDLRANPNPDTGRLIGRVVDAVTSEPIPMAWIALRNESSVSPQKLVTSTRADGTFELTRAPTGEWWAWAARSGYLPVTQKVLISKDQTTEIQFRLVKYEGHGVVEGDVRDTTSGAALANIHVIIPLIDHAHMANPNTALHAVTGVNGHYRIEGVPNGTWRIIAFGHGYASKTDTVTMGLSNPVEKDFFLNRLACNRIISIRVFSSRSGTPIGGARLSVPICDAIEPFSEWDLYKAVTSSTGLATLTGVPVGSNFLIGADPNYEAGYLLLPGPDEDSEGPISLLLDPLLNKTAARDWANYE